MLSIEDQISRIADIAFEQSSPMAEWTAESDGSPHRTNRVWLAVAAVVVLASLAATWTIRLADHAQPADQPPTSPVVPTNVPTVQYPPDQTWFVPTLLAGDLEYRVAEDRVQELYLAYDSPTTDHMLSISVGETGLGSLRADDHLDIAGVEWGIRRYQPAGIDMVRDSPDGTIAVSSRGLDEATLTAIVASIEPKPATFLPRPPLPLAVVGVPVATVTINGTPSSLFAATDGVNFALNGFSGGYGSSVQLDGQPIAVSSSVGPDPQGAVATGGESESLLWGLLRADVATVQIELTDGRIVTTEPQDTDGRFLENFFYVAIPTRSADGFELVQSIVVKDAAGNELARSTGVYGWD